MKRNIIATALLTTFVSFSFVGTSFAETHWGDGSQFEAQNSIEARKEKAKKIMEEYYKKKNEEIQNSMNDYQQKNKENTTSNVQQTQNNNTVRKGFGFNRNQPATVENNNINNQQNNNQFDNSVEGQMKKYMDEGQYKFKGGEEKPSKTLFCLIIKPYGTPSECRSLLKDFYKMVSNPKKYGNPQKFLNGSAIRNGNLKKHNNDFMSKQLEGLGGKSEDKQYMIDLNNTKLAIANAYIDQMDYTYSWDGKHPMFLGNISVDGQIIANNFYTCDTSASTGLNNKLDVKEERYRDGHGMFKVRYFIRTINKMPHNCLAKKHFYPKTTWLPQYNTQRCDGKYYAEKDYMRGYYEVEDKYGNKIQHKIEKNCWDSEEIEKAKLEEENNAALKQITEEIFKNKYSAKKAEILYHNYYAPEGFKVPVVD